MVAKQGHNQHVAGKQLLSIVERIEKLTEEKQGVADDIKDIFAESKSNGFDNKTVRKIIKLRAMDAADRTEQKYLLEIYCRALGLEALE